SRWSRWADSTHMTSSNSRSSELVGVRRSWARPGEHTSTLRSRPTSEWTPWAGPWAADGAGEAVVMRALSVYGGRRRGGHRDAAADRRTVAPGPHLPVAEDLDRDDRDAQHHLGEQQ